MCRELEPHKLLYLRCGTTDFSCGSGDFKSCCHTLTTHTPPHTPASYTPATYSHQYVISKVVVTLPPVILPPHTPTCHTPTTYSHQYVISKVVVILSPVILRHILPPVILPPHTPASMWFKKLLSYSHHILPPVCDLQSCCHTPTSPTPTTYSHQYVL